MTIGGKMDIPAHTTLVSQILPPPKQFLAITVHHIPGAPAAVIFAWITNELRWYAPFLERGIHLLALGDWHALVGFAVYE